MWSFNATEPVVFAQAIDHDRYFLNYQSHLLEQRKLKTNDLIWQKRISDAKSDWIQLTPDHQFFVMRTQAEHETGGVSFYSLDTGDYVFTAQTSETITDMKFYGDWFYLASENHFWAFQRKATPSE